MTPAHPPPPAEAGEEAEQRQSGAAARSHIMLRRHASSLQDASKSKLPLLPLTSLERMYWKKGGTSSPCSWKRRSRPCGRANAGSRCQVW